MDKDGWIPISLIASFHRIQQLTHDVNLMIEVNLIHSYSNIAVQVFWSSFYIYLFFLWKTCEILVSKCKLRSNCDVLFPYASQLH